MYTAEKTRKRDWTKQSNANKRAPLQIVSTLSHPGARPLLTHMAAGHSSTLVLPPISPRLQSRRKPPDTLLRQDTSIPTSAPRPIIPHRPKTPAPRTRAASAVANPDEKAVRAIEIERMKTLLMRDLTVMAWVQAAECPRAGAPRAVAKQRHWRGSGWSASDLGTRKSCGRENVYAKLINARSSASPDRSHATCTTRTLQAAK
jgi:hypothetical protein